MIVNTCGAVDVYWL